MRAARPLLAAVVLLCALGGGATDALATPCGPSTYAVSDGTLTITGGSQCELELHASETGSYVVTTTGSWTGTATGVSAVGTLLTATMTAVSAVRVVDTAGAPFDLTIAGRDAGSGPVPWQDSLTVAQTDPDSTTALAAATGLTAPISFGTVDLSVTSPSITVSQDVIAAASIVLLGTGAKPLIRADLTTGSGTGSISLNGARIREAPLRTLTAGTVYVTGPVLGNVGCSAIGVSVCAASDVLKIDGDLIATSPWSDLSSLLVTGNARLGGDVTTSATQDYRGLLRVSAAGRLTLAGGEISTLHGISAYTGPCVAGVIAGCAPMPLSPPLTFTDLTIAGDWNVGGSVTPTGSITVTGLTTALGSGIDTTFSPSTAGPQDYQGGLAIALPRAALISASVATIAGMPAPVASGAVGATACDTGPLTVIGNLQLTAAVACAGSLLVNGATTIAADVSTQGYQSYQGPVTIALGSGTVRLRTPAGQQVSFPDTTVGATWSAASGEVAGYTASIAPTGQTCTTTGALSCSFGAVPGGEDLTFSVAPQRPLSAAGTGPSATQRTAGATPGAGARRTVARGSRTPLTRLIDPPATRGRRVWSERGPCSIANGQLVAPRRRASCTLTLQVRRNGMAAWSGRALIAVR